MTYRREVTTSHSPVDGTIYRSERISPETPDIMYETTSSRGIAFVWYVLGIVAVLLGLRIAFLLFGAANVGFTAWLYSVTDPLVNPFQGVFPASQVDGTYFDTAAFVALIVYSLVAWAISELINLFNRPSTDATVEHF